MTVDSYQTISNSENILYKDKASKFIGYAYHVVHTKEIREKLEVIKGMHPKATHHCFAYRLGLDKNNYRFNDDGEPTGTAGKPILGQIDSKGLTNTLLIIVRYYGGTKLGVSGLINAYKTCAKLTLDNAQILDKKILAYYQVTTDYKDSNKLYHFVQKYKAFIVNKDIANECVFTISVEINQIDKFENELKELQIKFNKINY